jgi:predicted dehydrogenase
VSKLRIAGVGAGPFGRNHIRVIRESDAAELSGVLDSSPERASAANCRIFSTFEELAENSDSAVVSTRIAEPPMQQYEIMMLQTSSMGPGWSGIRPINNTNRGTNL